ncbi:MAG: sigma-54 interaction domain-containing protein [Candidatus Acidiferrales bacterium]
MVLLVEGEESLFRHLQKLLEEDGYVVRTSYEMLEGQNGHDVHAEAEVILLAGSNGNGWQELREVSGFSIPPRALRLSSFDQVREVATAVRRGTVEELTAATVTEDVEQPAHPATTCAGGGGCPEVAVEEPSIEEVAPQTYFVSASASMKRIRQEALRIAEADVPVLLLGESGTGKEMLALLIHKNSARCQRPFLKLNCAALPAELLESELFGYEAGAFTGASRSKPGKFELCNGGTILLDEIGEIHPSLQAKLLHVLQDGTFSHLGGKTTIRTDVRVLAATNVDVSRAIAEGRLREDLYYRLNAFTFVLPPLRERPEEIPVLLQHFLERSIIQYKRPAPALSAPLIERAKAYSWPGNLRELENFVKRYVILGDEEALLQDLREKAAAESFGDGTGLGLTGREGLKSLVRGLKTEAERKAIGRALEQTNWNRKEAARILSISYKALLYKIRQYGLDQA